MSDCTRHPGVPAALDCDHCRRPYCPNCVVRFRGRTACAGCKTRESGREQIRERFHAPADALAWSMVGFFCCFLLQIVTIIRAARALKEIKRDPQLPGKGLAITALVIGIVMLALPLAFVLLFLGMGVFAGMMSR